MGSLDSLKKLTNGEVNYGIKPGLSEAFIIDQTKKNELVSLDISSEEIIGNLLRGRNITRYGTPLDRHIRLHHISSLWE